MTEPILLNVAIVFYLRMKIPTFAFTTAKK